MPENYTTSIDIDAPPATVFAHLTTVEGMLAWLGQHAELDARPGGTFAVDIDGSPIRGRFEKVEPPHRVVVSWGMAGSEDFPPGSSRVEFTLTEHDGGTRLDLVHSGLPEPRAARYRKGWDVFLARLRTAAGLDPREVYDRLARDQLRRPDVGLGRSLRSETLTVRGKMFAFLGQDDRLVVKLPAIRAAALVAAGDAAVFESGGRRMKEWVAVALPGDWPALMEEARAHVGSSVG